MVVSFAFWIDMTVPYFEYQNSAWLTLSQLHSKFCSTKKTEWSPAQRHMFLQDLPPQENIKSTCTLPNSFHLSNFPYSVGWQVPREHQHLTKYYWMDEIDILKFSTAVRKPSGQDHGSWATHEISYNSTHLRNEINIRCFHRIKLSTMHTNPVALPFYSKMQKWEIKIGLLPNLVHFQLQTQPTVPPCLFQPFLDLRLLFTHHFYSKTHNSKFVCHLYPLYI